jgi:hypothetical protein
MAHLREICCVEIAARVCKKILRNNIVESMKKFHEANSGGMSNRSSVREYYDSSR